MVELEGNDIEEEVLGSWTGASSIVLSMVVKLKVDEDSSTLCTVIVEVGDD